MKCMVFAVFLFSAIAGAQSSGNTPAGSKSGAETVPPNSKVAAEGSGQANHSNNPLDTPGARKLAEAVLKKIEPGTVWKDENGRMIQAHGGGILKQGMYWYWFGEDRTQGLDQNKRYVSCYRSKDLTHWESKGQVLELTEPEEYRRQFGNNWQAERPKVFKIGPRRFVMYVHLDAAYKAAEVGVAVSENAEGPYRLVKHFRPLGKESRDIGQFVDDDGRNYLIFESRPTGGFYIAKLNDDGMDVTETAFVHAPLEGGAIVHYEGLYYVLGSHMTGWKPNPNVYATAKDLKGPWSEFKDIAPPEVNTYGTQSSMLIKVKGKVKTTVIYVGDQWKPEALWDSRYLWMPLEIGEGKMILPQPKPWTIDIRTGEVH
jgi:hypothetical protein